MDLGYCKGFEKKLLSRHGVSNPPLGKDVCMHFENNKFSLLCMQFLLNKFQQMHRKKTLLKSP